MKYQVPCQSCFHCVIFGLQILQHSLVLFKLLPIHNLLPNVSIKAPAGDAAVEERLGEVLRAGRAQRVTMLHFLNIIKLE